MARALEAADAAARRGASLVVVADPRGPLADLARHRRGVVLALRPGPGRSRWTALAPALLVAHAGGVVDVPPAVVREVADRLDHVAALNGPTRGLQDSVAITTAATLGDGPLVVLGAGPVAGAAARCLAASLAARAGLPAGAGAGEVGTADGAAALGVLDGAHASAGTEADLFRDRVDDDGGRPVCLLLRDDDEPGARVAGDAVEAVLAARGTPVQVWRAEGASAVERLASLVALADLTAVYAALGLGVDPAPRPARLAVADLLARRR